MKRASRSITEIGFLGSARVFMTSKGIQLSVCNIVCNRFRDRLGGPFETPLGSICMPFRGSWKHCGTTLASSGVMFDARVGMSTIWFTSAGSWIILEAVRSLLVCFCIDLLYSKVISKRGMSLGLYYQCLPMHPTGKQCFAEALQRLCVVPLQVLYVLRQFPKLKLALTFIGKAGFSNCLTRF